MARQRSFWMIAVVGVMAMGAGCTSPNEPAPSASSSPPGTATPNVSASPTGSGPTAACDAQPWQSAPIKVTHNVTVPKVPVVSALRSASHSECGFDRFVFDIDGPIPSYEVRYVATVTEDGSGKPITVPGSKFLLVTLHPAQGHDDTGANLLIPRAATLNYPMLKAYAVAGDFEGYVSVALGLAGMANVRVGELPGRLYVDVAY